MAERAVFIDAGPLICLARAGGLGWLAALFGTVSMTAVVRAEVIPGKGLAGEREIQAAIESGDIKVRETAPPLDTTPALSRLDPGERSVIEAAVSCGAESLAIIDDAEGRMAASEIGINITGTLGVLLMAKRVGLVPSVRAELQKLVQAGMFVSPSLVREVLDMAGE